MTHDKLLQTIARNVTRYRGTRSRYWLAKAVGVAPIQITRLERADNMPSATLLTRLADALDVSLDTLVRGPKKNVAAKRK